MSKAQVDLVSNGIADLLKSDNIMALLNEEADKIIDRCSGTYEKTEYVGKTRANVSIFTEDKKTYYKNLKNNELLKALK